MSKVLVDRQVLLFLNGETELEGLWFGERQEGKPFWWRKYLREALAQPAEAEGVERWSELRALAESAPGENWKAGNAYGKPFIPTYQVIADTVDGPCVILEGNKNFIEQAKAAVTFAAAANPAAVRELIAALSAVTAERDRLATENERLSREAKNDAIAYRAVIERQEELRSELKALKAQQGEPVAEIVNSEPYEDGSTNPHNTVNWFGRNAENDLPAGTKLYAAMAAKEA